MFFWDLWFAGAGQETGGHLGYGGVCLGGKYSVAGLTAPANAFFMSVGRGSRPRYSSPGWANLIETPIW